jgi:hypothetical protein
VTAIASLVERWQRAEIYVRCGLAAREPAQLQLYLHLGRKLAGRDDRATLAVQLRMLSTLLKSAEDEALPWFWRSVCLEHATLPLSQVTSSCRLHDPLAVDAIEAAVQRP